MKSPSNPFATLLIATFAWAAAQGASVVAAQTADSERDAEPPRVLSIDDALQLAAQNDPQLAAAVARQRRSEAEAMTARGRLLPRLDFEQSITRGDQPVYAFGTRLLQGRFGASDLALPALNAPSPITDHASRLSLRVPLVHAEGWFGARAARDMSRAAEATLSQAELELAGQVLRAYHGAQVAAAAAEVASQAVESARADAARVQSMLRNDMATELDALTMEVHVATMEQRAILARGEAAAALAALNHALGLPVGAPTTLSTPLDGAEDGRGPDTGSSVDVEALDLSEHPAVQQAQAREAAARAAHRAARARYAPVLAAAADLQSHRSQLVNGQHGESWTVGVVLQVNLFNGLQDLAQERAAAADLEASHVSAVSAESAVRLRVHNAQLALDAAEATLSVSARGVELARAAQALEQQRSRNGMNDAAALVRSQTALLDAELRHLSARHARDMARVELTVALGGHPISPNEVSP
ncbi:MAG: TolC family protein [Sandaracinaceae bacterium]|nr:TolC family protein [Sandaracinaceae bacterium]